jgi:hypothetical protein
MSRSLTRERPLVTTKAAVKLPLAYRYRYSATLLLVTQYLQSLELLILNPRNFDKNIGCTLVTHSIIRISKYKATLHSKFPPAVDTIAKTIAFKLRLLLGLLKLHSRPFRHTNICVRLPRFLQDLHNSWPTNTFSQLENCRDILSPSFWS